MLTRFYRRRRLVGAGAAALLSVAMASSGVSESRCKERNSGNNDKNSGASYVTFLGTGSSTGCPKPGCTYKKYEQVQRRKSRREEAGNFTPCEVSRMALQGDPRHNKNYRGNPSILVQYKGSGDESSNFVVDCGKTFREHFIRWAPSINLGGVAAVLLTHEHMDAYGGLDDLRGIQEKGGPSMPVYLSNVTLERVRRTFSYLVQPSQDEKEAEAGKAASTADVPAVKRHVASLSFRTFQDFSPLLVGNLRIYPLPVVHGEDCTCYGFAFGEKDKVLYLSDISRLPVETSEWISNWRGGGQIDVLVLDALFMHRQHETHFSLDDAAALIRRLKPKKALLVGMSCDHWLEHDKANEYLRNMFAEDGLEVSLAYDGQTLCLDL